MAMDGTGYDDTEHQKKIEQKYADKLSVKEYLLKDVVGSFVSIGAAALGAFGGYKIGEKMGGRFKFKSLQGVEHSLEETHFDPLQKRYVLAFAGWMVGGIVGGIASTYNMWRKKEASQLAVQELSEDVAGMTAIRSKTNPDLVKEMDSVRGMYDEVKAENASLRDKLGLKPRGPLDHAEAEPAATEAAR